jgi:ABC-2 type transport system ATP-binding protein
VLSRHGSGQAAVDATARRVSVPVRGAGVLAEVVRGLDEVGVTIVDIAMHRPSLDDVFMIMTGRPAVPAQPPAGAGDAKKDLVTT